MLQKLSRFLEYPFTGGWPHRARHSISRRKRRLSALPSDEFVKSVKDSLSCLPPDGLKLDGRSSLFWLLHLLRVTTHSTTQIKARKVLSEEEQHYYLGDELLNNGMPIEQLRSRALRTGRLHSSAEGQEPPATTVKMYVGKQPLDFSDTLLADVIAKLKDPQADEKTVNIRVHRAVEDTLSIITVNAATITVDGVKEELIRVLGPPSFTGLNVQNILLYAREKQPGRPLQGEEIRALFGPRPRLDLDVYPTRPPVNLTCKVLRWGIILKQRFELAIEDHLLLGDLKKALLQKLNDYPDPKISQRYTLDNFVFKLDKQWINAVTCENLRRKYGVEANELWLRVFDIKNGSTVAIHV